jgi:thiol:disulfide interchange protein
VPGRGAPTGRPAGSTRRDPLLLLIVAALLLILRVVLGFRETPSQAVPPAGPLSGADAVQWRTLEVGVAEARASGRPVLYDFTAEWCPPCRLMQRQVFSDPQAAAALESRFVPVRVLDRQREEGHNARWVDSLQARYRVNAFPTLIVTDAGGAGETRRVEGFMGREATLGQLGAGGVSLRWGMTRQAPPDRR